MPGSSTMMRRLPCRSRVGSTTPNWSMRFWMTRNAASTASGVAGPAGESWASRTRWLPPCRSSPRLRRSRGAWTSGCQCTIRRGENAIRNAATATMKMISRRSQERDRTRSLPRRFHANSIHYRNSPQGCQFTVGWFTIATKEIEDGAILTGNFRRRAAAASGSVPGLRWDVLLGGSQLRQRGTVLPARRGHGSEETLAVLFHRLPHRRSGRHLSRPAARGARGALGRMDATTVHLHHESLCLVHWARQRPPSTAERNRASDSRVAARGGSRRRRAVARRSHHRLLGLLRGLRRRVHQRGQAGSRALPVSQRSGLHARVI